MSLKKNSQLNKTYSRKGLFLYQDQEKAKKKGNRKSKKNKKTDKTYVCSVLLLFLNTYITQDSVGNKYIIEQDY